MFRWLLLLSFSCLQVSAVSNLFPFGPSNGDSSVTNGDDQTTNPPIQLNSRFPFFGAGPSSLYINTNGILSLNTSYTAYNPLPFPLIDGQGAAINLIAPFWADIDTSQRGNIYYRDASSEELLVAEVQRQLRMFFVSAMDFTPNFVFVVTWDSVGYFGGSMSTLTNTFQCLLISDGSRSYIMFRYDRIEWTAGRSSSHAVVGYNGAGSFFTFPSSNTPQIANITNSSNVGIDGLWAFRVDAAEPEPTQQSTTSAPTFASSTSGVQTTEESTNLGPETEESTDSVPTTEEPTNLVPETEEQTDSVPTTEEPTRFVPSTEEPTNVEPTTQGSGMGVRPDCTCQRMIECSLFGEFEGATGISVTPSSRALRCEIGSTEMLPEQMVGQIGGEAALMMPMGSGSGMSVGVQDPTLFIDSTFNTATISPGSFVFLREIGYVSRSEGVSQCNIAGSSGSNTDLLSAVLNLLQVTVVYENALGQYRSFTVNINQLDQVPTQELDEAQQCAVMKIGRALNSPSQEQQYFCRDASSNESETIITFMVSCL